MKKKNISAPIIIALVICISAISLMGFSLLSVHPIVSPQSSQHEYIILSSGGTDEIAEKVNSKLNSGWKTDGGICILPTTTNQSVRYYYQAMSK